MPSPDLNTFVQQLTALVQSMRNQSTTTPTSAPGTDQEIEQLRKLVEIGRGVLTPEAAKALTQRLGQVNGALGQTIGNMLDGKKTALGVVGALATAILQNAGPAVPLDKVIPILGSSAGLGSVAMPLFLALSAWGVLGKMEKWTGVSPSLRKRSERHWKLVSGWGAGRGSPTGLPRSEGKKTRPLRALRAQGPVDNPADRRLS